MSNFDPNAIVRGAQLTLVGGMSIPQYHEYDVIDQHFQHTELYKTPISLPRTTIVKLQLLSSLVLESV